MLRSRRALRVTLFERTVRTFLWTCLLLLGIGSPARADELAVQLTWRAPADCPSRDDVIARVRTRVGADARARAAWSAVAHIVRIGGAYRLELQLRTDDATPARRVLTGARCEPLADAAAVFIALALDPSTQGSAGAAAASGRDVASPPIGSSATPIEQGTGGAATAGVGAPSSPRSTAQGVTTRDVPTPPAAGSGADAPLALSILAGVALRLDRGSLPQSLGWGIGGELGLRLDRFLAIASFTLWLSGDAQPEAYPAARVRARGWSADLAAGYALAVSGVHLSPELRLEHGVLDIGVSRIASPAERAIAWTAAGAGVRATLVLPARLAMVVGASALLPFSRPRTLVRTPSEDRAVYTMAAVLLRFSVGASYTFD